MEDYRAIKKDLALNVQHRMISKIYCPSEKKQDAKQCKICCHTITCFYMLWKFIQDTSNSDCLWRRKIK